MTDREFWQRAYLARLRNGAKTYAAVAEADLALQALKQREAKLGKPLEEKL